MIIKIFPNFTEWTEKVLKPINENENNPDYMNDQNFSYSQENLYKQFILIYGEYTPNSTQREFINMFPYIYSQEMLTFHTQITIFKSDAMQSLSLDFYKTIREDSTSTDQSGQDESDERNTASPSDTTFTNLLDDLQINSAMRVKAINSFKNNSQSFSSTINNYRLFKMNEKTKFNSLIRLFLNSFRVFFSSIKSEKDNLKYDNDAQFLSGEWVSDVDYFGTDEFNARIKIVIEEFSEQLEKKQNTLTAGVGITMRYDVISAISPIHYNDGVVTNGIYQTREWVLAFIDNSGQNKFISWSNKYDPRIGIHTYEITTKSGGVEEPFTGDVVVLSTLENFKQTIK